MRSDSGCGDADCRGDAPRDTDSKPGDDSTRDTDSTPDDGSTPGDDSTCDTDSTLDDSSTRDTDSTPGDDSAAAEREGGDPEAGESTPPWDSYGDATGLQAVQAAAIDHAFAVGPPRKGLQLAGVLEDVPDGERPPGGLLRLVVTLVWASSSGEAADLPALTDSSLRSTQETRSSSATPTQLVVRGCAVAVERHGVSVANAAEAAGVSAGAVRSAQSRLDTAVSDDASRG